MSSAIATIIVALISAISSIVTVIITTKTNKKIETIDELKNEFTSRADLDKKENYKTFLTDFISDIENDVPKTDIQIKRAYELYEVYTTLGGNSYVHNHWDNLVKEGKI